MIYLPHLPLKKTHVGNILCMDAIGIILFSQGIQNVKVKSSRWFTWYWWICILWTVLQTTTDGMSGVLVQNHNFGKFCAFIWGFGWLRLHLGGLHPKVSQTPRNLCQPGVAVWDFLEASKSPVRFTMDCHVNAKTPSNVNDTLDDKWNIRNMFFFAERHHMKWYDMMIW